MATMIFLGAFYTVVVVVATTVLSAAWRSRRDLRAQEAESIRWHSDFHDLLARDRVCRHVLTGELRARECPNAFDCRECKTHAALLERRPLSHVEAEDEIFGMPFPLDRFYHRGHAWARPEPDGTVTVGIDDLGRRVLGEPESMELPRPGDRIQTNGTLFRIRKRGADVRVLSPVDGEVIDANGCELRVKPPNGEADLRHLLAGAEVRPWLMREMERLQLALSAQGAGTTLADGGVPVADIPAAYPKADWDAVCSEMFLMS